MEDKKTRLQRFRDFIKKQAENKDREGHLAWKINDIEVHKPEIKENYQDSLPIGWGTNPFPWHHPKGKYGGLKSPYSAAEKDAQHRAFKKQGMAYAPPKQPDPDQHHLPLHGGSGDHPFHPVQRDKDYLQSLEMEHHKVAEEYVGHHHSLTPTQHRYVVNNYKSDSEPYNKPLRDSQGKELARYEDISHRIRHMENITNHETPSDLHVFRGMHSPEFKKFPKGSTFTDHGFTGTSLRSEVAKNFSGGSNGALFHIHVPKGSKGHYLNSHHDIGLEHEQEFLLHRGTKFEVLGHSIVPRKYGYENDTHVTHLRVVSQGNHKHDQDTLNSHDTHHFFS